MFDDSGFGGSSMFDADHDGHLNAFERDNAECFLHDSDTFDQVIAKENLSSGGYRSSMNRGGSKKEYTPEEIEKLEKFMRTHPLFKPDSEKTFDERHPILCAFLFVILIFFCFIMLVVSESLAVH